MTLQRSYSEALAEIRKLRARKLARKASRGIMPTIVIQEKDLRSGKVKRVMMSALMKKIR